MQKIIVAGVGHDANCIDAVLEKLEEYITPLSIIGVEAYPQELELMRKIRGLQGDDMHKENVYVSQFQPIHLRDTSVPFMSDWDSSYRFWYRFCWHANQRGAQLVPLDFEGRLKYPRIPIEPTETILDLVTPDHVFGGKSSYLWKLMVGPHFNQYAARKTKEFGCTLAVVGGAHAKYVAHLIKGELLTIQALSEENQRVEDILNLQLYPVGRDYLPPLPD